MYKVFINEKKLSINNIPTDAEKNVAYEDFSDIEKATEWLENGTFSSVNLYGEDADKIWDDFCDSFTNIEAAGGVVENEYEEILFIHRLGKWDLPKGKLEPNETLEKTAVREVEEETGIKNLVLKNFITSTYHIYRERGSNAPILKTTFWYLMQCEGNQEAVPQTEEGITDVAWKNSDQIYAEVLPNTFHNIRFVLEEAEII